jgi:hypothetical protein
VRHRLAGPQAGAPAQAPVAGTAPHAASAQAALDPPTCRLPCAWSQAPGAHRSGLDGPPWAVAIGGPVADCRRVQDEGPLSSGCHSARALLARLMSRSNHGSTPTDGRVPTRGDITFRWRLQPGSRPGRGAAVRPGEDRAWAWLAHRGVAQRRLTVISHHGSPRAGAVRTAQPRASDATARRGWAGKGRGSG